MIRTNVICSEVTAGISELKKNPMAVMAQGDGGPVAILNRNDPVFYTVPAKLFEKMTEIFEDIELCAIAEERSKLPAREITLNEL